MDPAPAVPATALEIHALRIAISPERLGTYARRAHGNLRRGLDLYAWNCRAGAALLPILHANEVTLRNAVHRALTPPLESARLSPRRLEHGAEAPPEPGCRGRHRRRAELLVRFPAASLHVTRDVVHARADALRRLRNRIAHHEPLLDHDLHGAYHRALAIVRWISPTKAQWVEQQWPAPTHLYRPS